MCMNDRQTSLLILHLKSQDRFFGGMRIVWQTTDQLNCLWCLSLGWCVCVYAQCIRSQWLNDRMVVEMKVTSPKCICPHGTRVRLLCDFIFIDSNYDIDKVWTLDDRSMSFLFYTKMKFFLFYVCHQFNLMWLLDRFCNINLLSFSLCRGHLLSFRS